MKKVFFILILIIASLIVYFSLSSKVTNNLDSYIYELPFGKGTGHKVVQGYGGMFSHKNKAALDFGMQEGTPVYAAREGIIYSFKDDSNEGGAFPTYENDK
jgi:murein DD-endopeptidase MepM/ murein hydrolase activator NlpD